MNGKLPESWTVTNLENVACWGSGGTPSRKNPEFFKGNIPWIKTGELGEKYVMHAEEHVSEEAIRKSSAKLFPKGSVGIAMYGATIGKLSIWGIDASTNQACAVAQPYEDVLYNEYLYYFLLSEKRDLIKSGKGGAQPNISQGILKSWRIRLAPFNEQKRIVAKIEELFSELDKGVESLNLAREQLKVYRQSVLKHAFEGQLTAEWREENKENISGPEELLKSIQKERDFTYKQKIEEWSAEVKAWEECGKKGKRPAKPPKLRDFIIEQTELPELPEGWVWQCLGNLNTDVFDGPFGSNLKTSDYVDDGVRVIRLENIGYQEFINDKTSFVTDEKYESLKKHTVTQGDIIFSSFVTDGIRAVVLPPNIEKAVNKADCFCVRLNGETVLNTFVECFFGSREVYKRLESEIHGIGRPRINTTQLKGIPVPICSPQEQRQIIDKVSEKLSLSVSLDQEIQCQIERIESLRQSILRKAFSGRLVEQDESDEPASVLLERIQAEKEGGKKKRNAA